MAHFLSRTKSTQQTSRGSSTLEQAKDRPDRRLKNLARLARLDPKLLYPLKHRGKESQAHMALIRSREALVSCRTQLVNPGYAERSQVLRSSLAQVPCGEFPQR
jgi:hypothetical protein